MNKYPQFSFFALICFSALLFARSSTDIKADLASMVPAGKEARLAWIKGGAAVAFPTGVNDVGVYVVSSADGIVRKLYPSGSGVGKFNCVNFTADGTKVLVNDPDAGQFIVINWDGTVFKKVATTGNLEGKLCDYWRNPNGTDWAIVGGTTTVKKVNISSATGTGAVEQISSKAFDEGSCMISDDGTQLVGYLEVGPTWHCGLVNVSTGNFVKNIPDYSGCWQQMRAGSPIQYSHNMSGHEGPQLYNANGTQDKFIATSDTLKKWIAKDATNRLNNGCKISEQVQTSEGHRWTRERDYVTFYCGGSKMNPILWNASNNKWIYIEDGLGCSFSGDMDMVFAGQTEVKQPVQPNLVVNKMGQQNSDVIYSLNGKRLNGVKLTSAGAIIRKSGGAANLKCEIVGNK